MRLVSFLSGRMVAWTSNGQKAIEQDVPFAKKRMEMVRKDAAKK